jgi:hypothetical protein
LRTLRIEIGSEIAALPALPELTMPASLPLLEIER